MGTLVTLGACSERKLWAHDKAPWVQFVGVAVTHERVCTPTRTCHSALHIGPVPLGRYKPSLALHTSVSHHVDVTRRYTLPPCPLGPPLP